MTGIPIYHPSLCPHYVLQSNRISWKSRALIVSYSQKKEEKKKKEFLLFSIVLRIFNVVLEPLV